MGYLIRFLLLGLLFVLIARSFRAFIASIVEGASGPRRSRPGPASRGVALERDPVCGTFVVPSAALTLAGRDRPLYFCSERCREAYKSGSAPRAGAPR